MTTEKIKPLTPYFGSFITVVIAIVGGWNAMGMRMSETESKIKVLELQYQREIQQRETDEQKQDAKLETLQAAYIYSGQQFAVINTKLEMILDKKRP